jgi:hypothetical protein
VSVFGVQYQKDRTVFASNAFDVIYGHSDLTTAVTAPHRVRSCSRNNRDGNSHVISFVIEQISQQECFNIFAFVFLFELLIDFEHKTLSAEERIVPTHIHTHIHTYIHAYIHTYVLTYTYQSIPVAYYPRMSGIPVWSQKHEEIR